MKRAKTWLSSLVTTALLATTALGSVTVGTMEQAQAAVTGVKQVAGGSKHSVVVKEDGTVWNFGSIYHQNLGEPGTTWEIVGQPIQVLGLDSVTEVSAGNDFTLALKQDGSLWSWGSNTPYGQTGGGGGQAPQAIPGMTDVIAMDTGYNHSLALKSDGSVWAWGGNQYGKIGDGNDTTTGYNGVPKQVAGLGTAVAVSAGSDHSVVLEGDGTVWTFGGNMYGQLGISGVTRSLAPVQVPGLTDVVAVSAGNYSTYALKNDGTLWAWGSNSNGQLGVGKSVISSSTSTPVQVTLLSNVEKISAGGSFALAKLADGSVCSWGNNTDGQLGNGTTTLADVPVQLTDLTGSTALGAGNTHALAVKNDGTLVAWGNNADKQLGAGDTTDRLVPTAVLDLFSMTATAQTSTPTSIQLNFAGAPNVGKYVVKRNGMQVYSGATASYLDMNLAPETDYSYTVMAYTATNEFLGKLAVVGTTKAGVTKKIVTGEYHSLALKEDGSLSAFGMDAYGQLGDGLTTTAQKLPIKTMTGVSDMAAGYGFTLALKDGTLYSFGQNNYGQLGINSTATTNGVPTAVVGMTNVTKFASKYDHSLALKSDGTIWAWGRNNYGQLGDGTLTNALQPVQIKTMSNVADVKTGAGHSVFLKNDGTVWGLGQNTFGQLGNGNTIRQANPVQAAGLTNVTAIAAGSQHTLALKSDGTVWAIGYNTYGQLGNNSTVNSNRAVQVTGLTDVIAIDAGNSFSLALKSDGTVWAWGYNNNGQLGDGTKTNQLVPVQVQGLTGVSQIAAGGVHALALAGTKHLAWGSNSYGQLGDGTQSLSVTPVEFWGPVGLTLNTGSITATSITVTVNYLNTYGATSKIVLKRNDGTVLLTGTGGSYVDSGRTASTAYTYVLEAYDSAGKLLATKTNVTSTTP
jgi:alpha-tubulin suppressor-like RCC1 family protein